jgi:sialidase-1
VPVIEYVESYVVYENPRPHVHSRHGCFPGLVALPSGELIALFVLAEAFEAPNGTTWVTRSSDDGRSWRLQGPVYDKSVLGVETTDSLKATLLRDGTLA